MMVTSLAQAQKGKVNRSAALIVLVSSGSFQSDKEPLSYVLKDFFYVSIHSCMQPEQDKINDL